MFYEIDPWVANNHSKVNVVSCWYDQGKDIKVNIEIPVYLRESLARSNTSMTLLHNGCAIFHSNYRNIICCSIKTN
jgi:hypothetical protein